MKRRQCSWRVAASGAVAVLTLAACGGGSASPSPAAATPDPSPSGPTAFASVVFDRPFTITLPAGWVAGDQQTDMSALSLPLASGLGPRLGIDIQEVPRVYKDPCDPQSAQVDAGTSPTDLARWMESWAPLHATKPVAAKVAGLDALMVEEAFAGTPCLTANLWNTSGGYLDPQEHKRYFIVDIGGKRIVVTLVGRDESWDETLPAGLAVLDSLTFSPKQAP